MDLVIIDNHKLVSNTLPQFLSYHNHTLTIPDKLNHPDTIKVSLINDNNEQFNIVIGKLANVKIILEISDNLTKDNCYEVNVVAKEGSFVKYLLVANLSSTNGVINHQFDVKKDSNVNLLAGFISNVLTAHLQVNLVEQGANVKLRTLAISSENNNQVIDVKLLHQAPNTIAEMTNIGIASGDGSVVLNGVGKILQGMKNSSTYQTLKGIITSDSATVQVNPILIIDEFDVKAGHAATVGKLEEEALYYLRSRGLSLQEAEKLIINGLLNPIFEQIDDEVLKEKVVSLVNERI